MSDIEPAATTAVDPYARWRIERPAPPRFRSVRRGFRHEGEYQQAMRKVRPEWMTPICQAIALWEEHADPASPIGRDRCPFPALVSLFAENGVTDADAIGFTILRMQEQGLVEERGIEGVMFVRLLGPGRTRGEGGTLERITQALAPSARRPELEGPR